MKRMGISGKTAVVFLTLTLVLSPFQFSLPSFYVLFSSVHAGTPDDYGIVGEAILVEEDTTWTKDQDLSFNKRVFVVNGATLTITDGAEVVLGNDDPDSPEGMLDVLDGSLRVIGTEESPVRFRGRDHVSFSLYFENFEPGRPESFLRYAVIGEGGDEADGGGDGAYLPKWLISRALAAGNGFATVYYSSGRVRIENTQFANEQHPNVIVRNAATEIDYPGDFLRITNSNFANKPDVIAVQPAFDCPFDTTCQNRVMLKNDWFGAATGPKGVPDQNPVGIMGNGSVIDGPVILDGFRKKELIADPAIVIPGITGSAQVLGTWKLDPILHSYDDLVNSFERNGYETDMNLFTFPYDWRRDNETSAHYLQGKVEAVLHATGVSKVDLVAHSMGGLVARAYIEEVGGTLYDDTVDQLVTLGTPHDGSPEAYLKWEAGEGFFSWRDALAKHHFEQEAEEAGYDDNLRGYIQERVISIRQLLPDYSYLVDAPDTVRDYPTSYPRNDFLEELNSAQNKSELAAIDYTDIVGLAGADKTISRIRVVDSTVAGQWEHGMPENFYDTGTDQGLESGAGDDTVPESSAKGVEADTVIELAATHGDLPTKAQCEVFRTLSGKTECSYDESAHIANILLFHVFSPIDIQIVSPSGQKMGKNFEAGGYYDEIPGAYYTGFDTENEFITVPNPEKGEYKILTKGTGNGSYRVEAVSLEEDASGQAEESMATITGVAETGVEGESTVELKDTGEVVAEGAQDVISPTTTATFAGMPGTNGWYTSDVTVTLTATDNENGSGVEKTEYSLDGGTTWNIYTDPLAFTQEGVMTLQYFSTDKAGNKEDTKTETIKIDKTAPEGKISFNSTTQKLDISGTDNLGGVVSVVVLDQPRTMTPSNAKLKKIKPWFEKWWKKNRKNLPDMLATLTDEAGHTTSVTFEKTKDRKGFVFARVRSLGYDDSETVMTDALAQYKWRIDRKQQYQQLAARLRTGTAVLESRYLPKKNETWIRERVEDHEDDSFEHREYDDRDEDEQREWQKLPGMVVPYLQTENGGVKTGY